MQGGVRALALGLMLVLASCGGGGGGGMGGGNRAPAFTSPATATVAENTAGAFYTATASDPDGDAVTFSIAGGTDAALFRIAAGGALSFAAPPDFEAPTDANADNVYEVQLAASDGRGGQAGLALRVTVTDQTGGGFRVRRVGTGFAAPIFIAAMPDDSGRMLVVERAGRIRLLNPATGAIAATPFLDITGQVSTDGERGLLGLALAPDYMTSGRAYLFLTALDGAVQVRRYTSSGNRDVLDAGSGDVLISIPHGQFSNHNGGWLGFGRDGLLYLGTGDGGGGGDPLMNGQNHNTLLGKMLRLDVARDDFPNDPNRDYGIPAANPFAGGGGAGEVWLFGLRNPFRASFDRATGELWIGDVGQGAIEEVDRVRTAQSGLNLGWPLFEGTRPNQGSDPAGITMPVTQYSHGTGPFEGRSITGGFVYRGPVEPLQGLYVFADFISGNIWTVPIAGLTQGTTTPSSAFTNRNAAFTPDAGSLTRVVGFGEDAGGNLYIVSISGSVFAILPAG